MTILQNLQPMTRAKMAQLSLPDIHAYAKAYKVPADVIERGTVDELLDLIFNLRLRHPKRYPVNTPHLFTHKIARTQQDRDEEFHSHRPYTGLTHRQNLASFRRAKNSIGRPFFGQVGAAVGEKHQLGGAEGGEPRCASIRHEDPLVMDQPVATSSFEVADDLSGLGSALEEHQEAMKVRSKAPHIIVDDELFDLEFTPDMTKVGKESVVGERYAIAMSNHKIIEQMLAEAEAEAKQVLWQLTTVQPLIYATHENMQRFIDEFAALTGCRSLVRQAALDSERMAKDAWELDWNEEWIFTEDDEEEEATMKEIAQARAAGVRLSHPPSSPMSPSPRKRTRDEYEDELEYADEEELSASTQEPGPKRSRIESRETSTDPPSPYSKNKDKGKGRALVVEDSYTLPIPSSSFYIPPLPKPRFGPKERCNIYPVYKPAVPGYKPSQPFKAGGGNQPGQYDGGHLSLSDENDGYPDQGQVGGGDNGGGVRLGENGDKLGADGTQEHSHNTAQTRQGAPPPAEARPESSRRRGDPWQVLRYDLGGWDGYVFPAHEGMPSNLKRPVNWSMVGPQHPKRARFREWDDVLEEQNPWHQGGRPNLKQ